MKRVFSIFLILALSISWFGVLAEENIQTVSDISAEIEFLKQNGFVPIHFETNILRCETAALYGIAAMQTLISGKK